MTGGSEVVISKDYRSTLSGNADAKKAKARASEVKRLLK
jgi:hypothetical protein